MKQARLTACVSLLVVASVALGACARGPVESGDIRIGINSMNESDIRVAGTVEKDENISTETGNPWGEFIKETRVECEGDPVGFEVSSVTIALDTSSGGSTVSRFDDVIEGEATVFFRGTRGSDEDSITVDIASVDSPTGAGPVPLQVSATRSSLGPLLSRMVKGDFHVGMRAEVARQQDADFSMDVRVAMTAVAHCK